MIAVRIGSYWADRALTRIVENRADAVNLKGAIRRTAIIVCSIVIITFFRTYAISVAANDAASAIDCLIPSSTRITVSLIAVYFMAS